MSVEAISAALRAETPGPSSKLLLLVLANYADDEGYCYPGQETLCRNTGLGVRAVRDNLKLLEANGFISRSKRQRADGSRTSDLYRLLFLPGLATVERQPAKSAGGRQPAKSTVSNRHLTPKSPAADAGHEPKGNPSEESKAVAPAPLGSTSGRNAERELGGGGDASAEPWSKDPEFCITWDAYTPAGRRRSSRAKAWQVWRKVTANIPGHLLAAAMRRYVANDPDVKRTGGPGFHLWLADAKYEHWLTDPSTGPAGPTVTWNGPADVWTAMVDHAASHLALRGARAEHCVEAWLKDTAWQEQPNKAIICSRAFSADRIRSDWGGLLSSLGIAVVHDRSRAAA